MHTIALFGLAALKAVAKLGRTREDGTPEVETLEKLSSWSESARGDEHWEAKAQLSAIKILATKWDKRWHFWGIPGVLFALAQFLIFYFVIRDLFLGPGTTYFLWGCDYDDMEYVFVALTLHTH